jgi:hypothetical protein
MSSELSEGPKQTDEPTTITAVNTPAIHQVIIEPDLVIVNDKNVDGNITHTTFITTNPDLDVQVSEDLSQKAIYYDDEQDVSTQLILNDIKLYAGKIKCDDFHGKGTIEDYSELFKAASKIATESKQINLDVDVDGFNEFSQAADDLAKLFTSFITKLENVSIINDLEFLRSISVALHKIFNLSEVFGKFKQTILATSTVRLPKSVIDTKDIIINVMSEVNCAMNYINHFIAPSAEHLDNADLSDQEKHVIDKAVDTIENWNILCEQGISTAMAEDENIKSIANANNSLKIKSGLLKTATNNLKAKLALYNL